MQECKLLGQVGILVRLQLGEKLLDMGLGALENLPDLLYHLRQELQVALFVRYHQLSIPLVHICAVIDVELYWGS